VYKVLIRKLEGKGHLRTPRRRCDGSIKLHIQEVGFGSRHWIELERTCESGNETSGSIKCRVFLD
jgi:hypothetical protein